MRLFINLSIHPSLFILLIKQAVGKPGKMKTRGNIQHSSHAVNKNRSHSRLLTVLNPSCLSETARH